MAQDHQINMTQVVEGAPHWWAQAKEHLTRVDPIMAQLIARHSEGALQTRGEPFETLLRSVVGQQISLKAAEHIWERFEKACPVLTPEAIARKHRKTLRSTGLSERKVDFVLDICRFFVENEDCLLEFEQMDDEQIIERLCSIKGIGRWTAEMFLIFALLRPNVAPLVDYGFVKAIGKIYFPDVAFEDWSASDKKEEILSLTKRWHPYNTAATWYLWRSLNNGPMQY